MALRWYVVHVYSGFERKVAQSIREQAQAEGPRATRFAEVLVPTEEVVELRRGSKVERRAQVPARLRADQDGDDRRSPGTWSRTRRR